MIVAITIPGDPQTQGSLRRSPHGRGLYDANKALAPWRNQAAAAGADAMNGRRPIDGPIRLTALFVLQRPKSHRTSSGDLTANGRRNPWPTNLATGDLDKYERALGDALTGVVWADDSRIAQKISSKIWGTTPRTEVLVETAQPTRPSDDPARKLQRLAAAIGNHADDVDTTTLLGRVVAITDGFDDCSCGRPTDPLGRFCTWCGKPTQSRYAQDLPLPAAVEK